MLILPGSATSLSEDFWHFRQVSLSLKNLVMKMKFLSRFPNRSYGEPVAGAFRLLP